MHVASVASSRHYHCRQRHHHHQVAIVGSTFSLCRHLDDDQAGFESDRWTDVQQCIDTGSDVINLSLESSRKADFARELHRQTVEDFGIVSVAAAGFKQLHTYLSLLSRQ